LRNEQSEELVVGWGALL